MMQKQNSMSNGNSLGDTGFIQHHEESVKFLSLTELVILSIFASVHAPVQNFSNLIHLADMLLQHVLTKAMILSNSFPNSLGILWIHIATPMHISCTQFVRKICHS